MKRSEEKLLRQLIRESVLQEAKAFKPGTVESLKKWPKFYSYITAKYRDELPNLVVAIEGGGLLDVLAHPNTKKYPNQRLLVVTWDSYVYLVPYVEEAKYFFLKTVIPSRKATRDYLKTGDPDDAA